MDYCRLGHSDLVVSKMCFGSLTLGPLQRNLSIDDGHALIAYAVSKGVNFIDTADLYGTYSYIRPVIEKHPELIIATKSYAYDRKTASDTFERAIKGLGREYIDIFLLHEQEGPLTLKGHREALLYFIELKKLGKIKCVGISTHTVAAVRAAAQMDEIDIIHPILNVHGFGIVDGTRDEMEAAIKTAWQNGKGIYTMKPLGGGHLIAQQRAAFSYLLDFPYIHSVAVGMQRYEEIDANLSYFSHRELPRNLEQALNAYKRQLFIQDWCSACGQCIEKCAQRALYMNTSGKTAVDLSKCIFCGYCGAVCKDLAIKVL